MTVSELQNLKLKELQELAKEKGIKNISRLKKDDLVNLLGNSSDSGSDTDTKNRAEVNDGIEYSDPVRRTNLMSGVLEIMADGYGFLRSDNYQSGENDVYVSQNQIRRFNLKTGDYIVGNTRMQHEGERYQALLYVQTVNGDKVDVSIRRKAFDDLTPVYPDQRLRLERGRCDFAMRMIDLISPIGKGQRGIIVAPPKAGKTTLLKSIANSITENNPDVHLIVLLIDERPEEVTDMQRSIKGDVIFSTFDEEPTNHTKVAEIVLERAKRLVEHKKDIIRRIALCTLGDFHIPCTEPFLYRIYKPSALLKFRSSPEDASGGTGSVTVVKINQTLTIPSAF